MAMLDLDRGPDSQRLVEGRIGSCICRPTNLRDTQDGLLRDRASSSWAEWVLQVLRTSHGI
ncbi:unnamed protein product [Brassica oleracea var. botrytis]